jgi:cytochrome P450
MARLTAQRETLGDYAIPKGSRVTINIYSVHHNPHVWDSPFEFKPERFNEENSKGRPSTGEWVYID